jgi:hypothetical protein
LEKFRSDIKFPVIKMSVTDEELLYEAIADLPDYPTETDASTNYDFDKLDKVIFQLADRWIGEDNKKKILWTFLLLYKCHSVKKVSELLVKKNGDSIKEGTVNKYRTEAIRDIKEWVKKDDKVREKIKDVLEEQYHDSRER